MAAVATRPEIAKVLLRAATFNTYGGPFHSWIWQRMKNPATLQKII